MLTNGFSIFAMGVVPTVTKSPTFTNHPQSICPLKRIVAVKPFDAHGGAAFVTIVLTIFGFHNNAPNQMMGGFYQVTDFH